MTDRVAVFVDGANLLHGLSQDFDRIDVDFEALVRKLLANRSLTRVYYYTALPNQTRDPERYTRQQKFLYALQRKPYFTVVLGRLEPRPGGLYVEKGVDISLAIDLLDLAYHNTYDTAVLITGDGDFSRAVQIVQRMGKHVENASTQSCLSRNLQDTCDITTILSKTFLSDCWMRERRKAVREDAAPAEQIK